ncbi:MAG TPA: helix-turn-helix domain-containing protein [Opitutaceae bacterium]|nr:helix-turn-helix domain-containing protein [Opitutaceae bacterium]
MPQSLWKRKAIADREEELLNLARRMLTGPGGMHGLTMERLAEATPYSKGTLYQHFGSKDDLLAALWIRPLQLRLELYRRASLFHGRARERILAIEAARRVVFALHPESEVIEGGMFAGQGNVNPKRAAKIAEIAAGISGVSLGIVRDAAAAGDLTLGGELTAEHVYIALRSLAYGLMHGWQSTGVLQDLVAGAGPELALDLANRLLDGLGWKPLLRDWDYRNTLERIWSEVFPDEARRMNDGAGRRRFG